MGMFSDLNKMKQKGETERKSPTLPSKEPRNLGTKVPTKEASKLGTLETRNLGKQPPRVESGSRPEPIFDINEPAERSNTYAFSQTELRALKVTEFELEETYGVEAAKYNIVRLGVHYILADFRKNRDASFLITQLRKIKK